MVTILRVVFSLMVGCAFLVPMLLNVSPLTTILPTLTVDENEISSTAISVVPKQRNLTDIMKERKTSFPFKGDPECQHFVVQVRHIPFLLFIL